MNQGNFNSIQNS